MQAQIWGQLTLVISLALSTSALALDRDKCLAECYPGKCKSIEIAQVCVQETCAGAARGQEWRHLRACSMVWHKHRTKIQKPLTVAPPAIPEAPKKVEEKVEQKAAKKPEKVVEKKAEKKAAEKKAVEALEKKVKAVKAQATKPSEPAKKLLKPTKKVTTEKQKIQLKLKEALKPKKK